MGVSLRSWRPAATVRHGDSIPFVLRGAGSARLLAFSITTGTCCARKREGAAGTASGGRGVSEVRGGCWWGAAGPGVVPDRPAFDATEPCRTRAPSHRNSAQQCPGLRRDLMKMCTPIGRFVWGACSPRVYPKRWSPLSWPVAGFGYHKLPVSEQHRAGCATVLTSLSLREASHGGSPPSGRPSGAACRPASADPQAARSG